MQNAAKASAFAESAVEGRTGHRAAGQLHNKQLQRNPLCRMSHFRCMRRSATTLKSPGRRTLMDSSARLSAEGPIETPWLEVIIEVPRGSFLKRGSTGHLDFVSPLPCPFNYGSVPAYIGLEGDLLDAVVLGPRLPRGSRVRVQAFGAVGLTDRGMYDDKLICSPQPLRPLQRQMVLWFFRFYARCKGLLNLMRGHPGLNRCEGWCGVEEALARARPRGDEPWRGPSVHF
jgi:inorganic pyrophosphatase